MTTPSDLNAQLWQALGLRVQRGYTLAKDGQTWLKVFIREEGGMAISPPDFEHSLDATMAQVPKSISLTCFWSEIDQKWVFVLSDWRSGMLLSEGRAVEAARAAAKALLGWKQLEAVRG